MLSITWKNQRGEARSEAAEILGDGAFWSMAGVLIPRSFWQLELMFKSNDKPMKTLGPYQSTALLLIFSDSVASTRFCASHLSTEHYACLPMTWLAGQWEWESLLLELALDFTFMSLDFKSLPMSVCRIIKFSYHSTLLLSFFFLFCCELGKLICHENL